MHQKRGLSLLVATIILIACACTPSSVPVTQSSSVLAPTVQATPFTPEKELNFIIQNEGHEPVQIKRVQRGWFEFQPATFGTIVSRGDLIRPPADGAIIVLCADLSVHTLIQETGSPCQVENPTLIYEGLRIITPMAANQNVPFIIYPRNTNILEDRPLLRWHDTGSSSYSVSLIREGMVSWQQTGVTGSKLQYPADAPRLQPGARYLLEVVDDSTGISSSQDPIKGLGFELITTEKLAEIRQMEAEIRALPIDKAGQDFVLAIYYASQHAYGSSLELLNELNTTEAAPLVHLWRGNVLRDIRLYSQAQAAYMDGLSLAETTGILEVQAQAEVSLWEISQNNNHFDKAIAIYRQLGDEQAIIDLSKENP